MNVLANTELQDGRRLLTHQGVTDSLSGWARRAGLRRDTIYLRLKRGWSLGEALETPSGRGRRAPRLRTPRKERTGAWAPPDDGVKKRRARVRFDDCASSQMFVNAHPGGATLDEVGVFFGITRERVRQIEARALAKLAHARPELAALIPNDEPQGSVGHVSDEVWGG